MRAQGRGRIVSGVARALATASAFVILLGAGRALATNYVFATFTGRPAAQRETVHLQGVRCARLHAGVEHGLRGPERLAT
jgi:hypothetical protein